MQMHLNLGQPYEEFIKGEIEGGLFNSASEVIRDSLRQNMKKKYEKERISYIHALVNAGAKQIEDGESVPYTDSFMDESLERAILNAESGKSVTDVIKG